MNKYFLLIICLYISLIVLACHYHHKSYKPDRCLREKEEAGVDFREIIADVYVNGHSLKDMQLAFGISRPYSGGKRKGWCKGNKRKHEPK